MWTVDNWICGWMYRQRQRHKDRESPLTAPTCIKLSDKNELLFLVLNIQIKQSRASLQPSSNPVSFLVKNPFPFFFPFLLFSVLWWKAPFFLLWLIEFKKERFLGSHHFEWMLWFLGPLLEDIHCSTLVCVSFLFLLFANFDYYYRVQIFHIYTLFLISFPFFFLPVIALG